MGEGYGSAGQLVSYESFLWWLFLLVSFLHSLFHSFFIFRLTQFQPHPSPLVSHILAGPFYSNATILHAPILLDYAGILPRVPLVSRGTECSMSLFPSHFFPCPFPPTRFLGVFRVQFFRPVSPFLGSGVALQTPLLPYPIGQQRCFWIPKMGVFELHNAKPVIWVLAWRSKHPYRCTP